MSATITGNIILPGIGITSSAYNSDDVIDIATDATFPALALESTASRTTQWEHTLVNAGFETGDFTGWTTESGTPVIGSSTPDPYAGSYYFQGGSSPDTIILQEIDLLADNVPVGDIDAGKLHIQANWFQSAIDSSDYMYVVFRFKDSGKTLISQSTSDNISTYSDSGWLEMEWVDSIPVDTRYVDLVLVADNADGYIDSISALTRYAHSFYRVTDFSEYEVGQFPSDWSASLTSDTDYAEINTNNLLEITGNIAGYPAPSLYSWDEIGRHKDVDVRVKWTPLFPETYSEADFRIWVRGLGPDSDYQWYSFGAGNNTSTITYCGTELGSGTYPSGDQYYDIDLDEGEWYWTRFKIEGSTISAKIWNVDDSEPAFWPLEHTHTGLIGPGKVSIGTTNYAASIGVSDYKVAVNMEVAFVDVDLPEIHLTAYGFSNSVESAQLILPMLELEATAAGDLLFQLPETFTLPMVTLNAIIYGDAIKSTELLLPGIELNATWAGDALKTETRLLFGKKTEALFFPGLGIEANGLTGAVIAADIPLPGVEIDAFSGARLEIDLPAIDIVADVLVGGICSLDLEFPFLRLESKTGACLEKSLPDVRIEFEISTPVKSRVTKSLPAVSLLATGGNRSLAFNKKMPFLRIVATGSRENTAKVDEVLPGIRITAHALSGSSCSFSASLPAIELGAESFSVIMLFDMVLPCLVMGVASGNEYGVPKSSISEHSRFEDETILRHHRWAS